VDLFPPTSSTPFPLPVPLRLLGVAVHQAAHL
jgi:hypothetical protein